MSFWLCLLVLTAATWTVVAAVWWLADSRAWRFAAQAADRGVGLPPAALLAAALAVAAVGALLFLLLVRTWQAQPSGHEWPMDAWASTMARDAWSPTGRVFMSGITALGDPAMLWSLAAGFALVLLWHGERALALGWIVALAGNAALNPMLKSLYERVRPDSDLSRLVSTGYSFPSGHSSGAMVAYGMLAYLATRLLPPGWRLRCVLLAALLIIAVGASRIYLQAHFLSDVLAGFASGGAWLAACVTGCAVFAPSQRRNRP